MDKKVTDKDDKTTDNIKKDNRSYAFVVAGVGAIILVGSGLWYMQSGRPQGVWVYTILAVVGILSLLAFVHAWVVAKQSISQEPDYHTLFVMGLVWAPLGLLLDMLPLFAAGAVFAIVGYHNRYRWKRVEVTKQQKKKKAKLAIGFGLLLLLSGLVFFLLSTTN